MNLDKITGSTEEQSLYVLPHDPDLMVYVLLEAYDPEDLQMILGKVALALMPVTPEVN